MTSYKDLTVWQKSFVLVLKVYEVTKNFPNNEKYVLVPQIRRSAISLPSNIAEGFTRKSTREYIQFLQIAYSSSAELETQLLVSNELKYFSQSEFQEIQDLILEVQKMLSTLIINLKRKIRGV